MKTTLIRKFREKVNLDLLSFLFRSVRGKLLSEPRVPHIMSLPLLLALQLPPDVVQMSHEIWQQKAMDFYFLHFLLPAACLSVRLFDRFVKSSHVRKEKEATTP